jgi:asparagine synthase (glutamine-hydrolysing)
MCGIAGILADERAAEVTLRRDAVAIGAALARRGPDGEGLWLDANAGVALAHRRLAVLDPSPAGAQPMVSASGRHVIVFNGEITNTAGLAGKLSIAWRGRSDTEVLLEHWERFGAQPTLAALEGMFALAVLDRATRRLTLARDGFGIKPLCWFRSAGTFAFASDLRGLRQHPLCPTDIDPASVGACLRTGAVPAPWSILAGVSKLAPGTMLTVERGREPVQEQFWAPSETARDIRRPGSDPSPEGIAALLEDSVARNLVADRPVGVLLSGGLDSAVVAAFARRTRGEPLPLYTMGFDDPACDETAEAAGTAHALGCPHRVFRTGGRDALAVACDLPAIHDEPFADSSAIPTILLARAVAGEVTVALGGDGGDEVFGGYDRYRWAMQARRYRQIVPLAARRAAAGFARLAPVAVLDTVAAAAGIRMAHAGHKLRRVAEIGALEEGPLAYRAFTSPPGDPLALMAEPAEHLPPALHALLPCDDATLAMQAMDAGHYLPDVTLAKVDRAGMAFGLEVRFPMLDRLLLGQAWRASAGDRQGKRLLRRMAGDLLPAVCLDRPKKGFRAPLASWLRRDLRDWSEDLLAPHRLKESGVLDVTAIRTLWREHISGRLDHGAALWSVLAFENWRRTPVLAAAGAAPPGQ